MSEAASSHPNSSFMVNTQVGPSRLPLEVYHLSHDLRGPLNAVLGFCELMLEEIEGPINDIQRADLTAIYHSALNLLTLISNMVDLSKLEANRLTCDFAPVEIKPVIDEIVADDLGPIKSEQPPQIVAYLPPTLPPIWADRERVRQMLKGLLRFAAKHQQEGDIHLTALREEGMVTFRVDIVAVHFSPEEVEDLFNLAVHIDSAGRSELGRGGLDLPLARFLAEKHQGRAWARRQKNGRLGLYISLPISETLKG
jgi:signal transduction histidine kinase